MFDLHYFWWLIGAWWLVAAYLALTRRGEFGEVFHNPCDPFPYCGKSIFLVLTGGVWLFLCSVFFCMQYKNGGKKRKFREVFWNKLEEKKEKEEEK